MEEKNIVITGMGAVTPIGVGVEAFWQALLAGTCGIGPITRFDTGDCPIQVAAEVKDFDPLQYMPRSLSATMDPFMRYAYVAAQQALTDSGLPQESYPSTGLVLATAMGGVSSLAQAQEKFSAGGKVGPRVVPMTIGNIAAAQIAIAHKIQGPTFTVSTACSAGGDGVMTGAMLLRAGEAEAVLVVGGESALTPVIVSSLARAKALTRNPDGQTACRPFDAQRDGFVIGEGGGAILLETEAHAKARGAKVYARLAGWGNTGDAHHVTAPCPDGAGAAACMKKALAKAGLVPEDIDYINAHGTSTPVGDIAETMAAKAVFGSAVPPMSSTKSSTGHMMGAGGIVELIACVLSIRDGVLPATLHLTHPDPACDLDYVPNTPRQASVKAAMSNSLGFGGQNSSVIVTKY